MDGRDVDRELFADAATSKTAWRMHMKDLRSHLDRAVKREWDRQLTSRLEALKAVAQADCICAYLSFRGEAGDDVWIEHALKRGACVCAPVLSPTVGMMTIRELTALSEVQIGPYGLRQPRGRVISPEHLDVIIVPGLAFVSDGRRLGMGGGYYDRFLPRCRPDALRIALAYDAQIVRNLPCDDYDERVDVIVTPTRVLFCPERRSLS